MPIDAIGNVISEAVAQHSLAVRFPYTIALTKPAEGMPAGVRAFFFYAQLPQHRLHIPPELLLQNKAPAIVICDFNPVVFIDRP